MKIIGLTGGIGTGKSTVAQFLIKLGVAVLEADKLGHELLLDKAVKEELADAFGKDVMAEDGTVDRKALSGKVFGNPDALNTLNGIIHPRMYERTVAKFEEFGRSGAAMAVLDAPLLVEADITSLVDEIWVTTAPEATVLERIKHRSGLSAEETLARIRSQALQEDKLKVADVVIDTDCSLEELEAKVKALWKERIEGPIR